MNGPNEALVPAGSAPLTRGGVRHDLARLFFLGGISLLAIPLVMVIPESTAIAAIIPVWLVADLINHPHFAASYLIFYRNFLTVLRDRNLSLPLRARYFTAGFAVPLVLVAFFAWCVSGGDAWLLSLGANLMFFLVGWHYVKQGYGVMIVEAVRTRRFFDDHEKKWLLRNAYACWILYWLVFNHWLGDGEFWGISYQSLPVPDALLVLAAIVAGLTTLRVVTLLAVRIRTGAQPLPIAGVTAYLVSVYFWLAGRLDPALLLLIPAFHSLQYLVIVRRYEANRASCHGSPGLHLALFAAMSIGLGYFGFWIAPGWLDANVPQATTGFGEAAVGFFVVWIFINVHHYAMDNAIWRGDNPTTARYLFGAPRAS